MCLFLSSASFCFSLSLVHRVPTEQPCHLWHCAGRSYNTSLCLMWANSVCIFCLTGPNLISTVARMLTVECYVLCFSYWSTENSKVVDWQWCWGHTRYQQRQQRWYSSSWCCWQWVSIDECRVITTKHDNFPLQEDWNTEATSGEWGRLVCCEQCKIKCFVKFRKYFSRDTIPFTGWKHAIFTGTQQPGTWDGWLCHGVCLKHSTETGRRSFSNDHLWYAGL